MKGKYILSHVLVSVYWLRCFLLQRNGCASLGRDLQGLPTLSGRTIPSQSWWSVSLALEWFWHNEWENRKRISGTLKNGVKYKLLKRKVINVIGSLEGRQKKRMPSLITHQKVAILLVEVIHCLLFFLFNLNILSRRNKLTLALGCWFQILRFCSYSSKKKGLPF